MALIERSESASYQQVDHFFTVSEAAAASLVDHYGICSSKVTVTGTGLGFSTDPSPKEDGWESCRLLFVAKQRFEDKGAGLLLPAFKIAQRRRPGLTMSVVGGGPLFERQSVPGVQVHSQLTLEQLHNEFRSASLFVMPALNEPWGLVYLEALSFGLPIMGLDRNAFPEIAGRGAFGYVVPEPTVDALATSILSAIADPVQLRERGIAGRVHLADRFTWGRVAGTIEATIRETC